MTKTQNLRIGLDVSQMVYRGHGVGRYSGELARALLTISSPHQFVFYAGSLQNKGFLRLRSRNKPWSRAKWVLPLIPPRIARLLFNYTSLPVNIFTGRLDIFHTSDWTEPVTSCPSVSTVHDLVFRKFPETVDRLVYKTQLKRMQRVIKYSTHIIADSQSTKNDLMKEYRLKDSRITVVYPGIDQQFCPQKNTEIERVKNKYLIEGDYLLALGTREPRKNLTAAVAAFQALGSSNLKLVIVGRHGWGREDFSDVENVIFTDFVEDIDLPALYSGASVFVFPSLYEGFGFPVLEAMACGTPVVASDASSIPELTGEAGVLVDPTNPNHIASGIAQALRSSHELRKLGIKRAALFSWEKCARETLAVYEKVVYEHRT